MTLVDHDVTLDNENWMFNDFNGLIKMAPLTLAISRISRKQEKWISIKKPEKSVLFFYL